MIQCVVFKYTITSDMLKEVVSFQMPASARFLHCAEQRNNMCLWFECLAETDKNLHLETRKFQIVATGDPVIDLDYMSYLGTAHFSGGIFVFHVYEVRN